MCGIVGFLNFSPTRNQNELEDGLTLMVDSIKHRGPDDRGMWRGNGVFLGMRRLSIIDLETGQQPMFNEDGSCCIVYNGELYNYLTLRPQLVAKGHTFKTQSDTEVILHAYEEWGVECLQRFNGMFAFAIWDSMEKSLFIARDRLGIKPLYYFYDDLKKHLIFASEIKAILASRLVHISIDPIGLNNYFSFGQAMAPHTIYKDIEKLLPGHFIIAKDGSILIQKYWDLTFSNDMREESEEFYIQRILALLTDSVKSQLMSDVPIGVFLSGGIDSSAVVALMAKLLGGPSVKTFSVGFADLGAEFNELSDARLVAQHFETDHHELLIKPSDLLATVEKLTWHFDEPFGDAAALPVYLVSKFAREHVKVVLTGEGGDELFAGYRRLSVERFSALYRLLPALIRDRIISKAFNHIPRFRRIKKALLAMSVEDPSERCGTWLSVFTDEMKEHLFVEPYRKILNNLDMFEVYRRYWQQANHFTDYMNRILYVDFKSWLPDAFLEKIDKASMAASLEARVPFLDMALVEFAATIPFKYKIKNLKTKYILKRAIQGLVPVSIMKKKKHGFAVPTDPWFRGELKQFVFDVLMDNRTLKRGYFNRDYIESLYKLHLSGREVYNAQLWLLLMFELWHREYYDNQS